MQIEPTLIERAAQPYVGIRKVVTMATMSSIADEISGLFAHLAQLGIAPAGPPFLRYELIDMERELVVQAGVPITPADVSRAAGDGSSVDSGGERFTSVLPAGRFVDTTYEGSYADLVDVTREFLQWAADRSLVWDSQPTDDGDAWGCRLEQYLTDPAEQPDMTKHVTELTFRLAD
jgi:effector-binding domain-containing protein